MTDTVPQLASFRRFQREKLGIDADLSDAFLRFHLPLAERILETHRPGRMLTVGVSGSQASGKSTLAKILQFVLEERGLRVVPMSIDDIYLPWTQRRRLQEQEPDNPYYQVSRGNPGTHDVALGAATIAHLATADEAAVTPIPAFDKSRHQGKGDPLPADQWPTVRGRPDVFILEGWCVGMSRLEDEELARLKQNVPEALAFERERDPDGHWGRIINDRLAGYESLFGLIDFLVLLRVPSLAKIVEWRIKQERSLRAQKGEGMSDAQVVEFIRPYMLLTGVHGLQVLGDRRCEAVDAIIELGDDQQPTRWVEGGRPTGRRASLPDA
ncbi:MAG: hypothetical protein P9L99_13055 [Candidatus Lernaella stagnicola]|nr:hypothetical protein [Candidatus Lernaella stagnicola]